VPQNHYLNLGAGRVILPGERPAHHALVPEAHYAYPLHLNIDRNPAPGIDCVMDLFAYPWPLESDSYDGALLSHLVEHIPHEINLRHFQQEQYERSYEEQIQPSEGRWQTLEIRYPSDEHIAHARRMDELSKMQDGWFAFWSELHRVLTDGAIVHVLAPYGLSHGWLADPSHTRPIVEGTFSHSMKPDPKAPFEYSTGGLHFEVENISYGLSPAYAHMAPLPTDPPDVQQSKSSTLDHLMHSQLNVASEIYAKLRSVKS
jgi:hypothetical protein